MALPTHTDRAHKKHRDKAKKEQTNNYIHHSGYILTHASSFIYLIASRIMQKVLNLFTSNLHCRVFVQHFSELYDRTLFIIYEFCICIDTKNVNKTPLIFKVVGLNKKVINYINKLFW